MVVEQDAAAEVAPSPAAASNIEGCWCGRGACVDAAVATYRAEISAAQGSQAQANGRLRASVGGR